MLQFSASLVAVAASKGGLLLADSTGGCNSLLESFSWRFVSNQATRLESR
jgi:hypothetical protein